MGEVLKSYCLSLIGETHHDALIYALIVFCMGTVVFVCTMGWREGWKLSVGLLLTEYVAILLCSTVAFRNAKAIRQYDYMPFWSYAAYFQGGHPQLLAENIMNVVVFVPVGFLLGMMIRPKVTQVTYIAKISSEVPKIVEKRWKRGWLTAILVGAGISIGIEMLQFILKRGFSELDDVMHNTLKRRDRYCFKNQTFWIKSEAF